MKYLVWSVSKVKSALSLVSLLFCLGCEDFLPPSDLYITDLHFTETYSNKYLDLPNGVSIFVPPNFDINDPQTWTGDAAQYVNHNYWYDITYAVENSGGSQAYDTEMDLHLIFDNGDEEIETHYVGDIKRKKAHRGTLKVYSTNRQLVECYGEIFWYE